MATETEIEALDYMRNNNVDGEYDSILADFAADKITVGILRYSGAGIEHLRRNNVLGRYDDLIAHAEHCMNNPVLYVSPKKA